MFATGYSQGPGGAGEENTVNFLVGSVVLGGAFWGRFFRSFFFDLCEQSVTI